VHDEPMLGQFLEIQTVGFGQADLGYRLAESATGPWTPVERFYHPEESETPGVLVYAAKGHPHLAGADLALTYATNIQPFRRLVRRSDLYYPRFLKAWLGDAAEGSPTADHPRSAELAMGRSTGQ